ncbi:hypothetical protein ACE6H2_003860 [Prunus campanulata]
MSHVQILVFVSDRISLSDPIRKSEIVPPESSFVSDLCSHNISSISISYPIGKDRKYSLMNFTGRGSGSVHTET